MEQNLPLVAKKVWSLVRLMLFMLKKGINKRKLLLDLNLMIKRGKLAGKALQNLMFNHHHNWSSSASSVNRDTTTIPPPPRRTDEYEFSCSSTPSYPISFFKKNHGKKKKSEVGGGEGDEIMVDAAMIKALEMVTSAAASPAVLGFGRSPAVRQLRITDSPFPVSTGEEDSYVDEAAEKFIMKFYSQLRRQN
ncbi:hypothetical protein OSB04_004379 [Centaurea solstitialis]|uniref:Avr9/Cf-9 rapidly elicited protein 146 n=1 Tax=Centaurea solstitialis TaxID=347529 RepID=A0AA38U432_9ASTR|nr:hypothetical protein OSB04_004379 [Centaurea solstitialis]